MVVTSRIMRRAQYQYKPPEDAIFSRPRTHRCSDAELSNYANIQLGRVHLGNVFAVFLVAPCLLTSSDVHHVSTLISNVILSLPL